jgi:processive 1,2-diacylglycerol beta-glucosyltransferase
MQSGSFGLTTARYQALEESAGIYKFGVNLYNWIQKKCPALHHLYFNFLEFFHVSASRHILLGRKKFVKKLLDEAPDIIVSVHAHTNHAFRAVAQSTLPNVRFVTYCGEMHGGYGFSKH